MPTNTTTVQQLAEELGLPASALNEFIRLIRDIRDDREMRPRLRAVHPHTPLTSRQADWVRELDRMGREG